MWLAWLTHNVSDVHGNADSASRTEWGQPLVLGVLTAAIVIGLAEPATGPPETAATSLGTGWDAIKLEHAVRPGDTLRAESLIERVEASGDGDTGSVERLIVGRTQDGTEVVRIRERRQIRRRPAGPAAHR